MCPSKSYRHFYNGLDIETPLIDGGKTGYINFDNAASTPPFKSVQKAVEDFMNYYSSVHRGTGFKSQLSTHVFEESREIVLRFVGADPKSHTVIFVKNTTEAVNKLARRFPFTDERNVVITSGMEHHSNDLPWRANAEAVHVDILEDGRLDLVDFDAKLAEYGERIALVSITGASNVSGFINPIHDLAEKAHAVGAMFCADLAQMAPHRKVEMLSLEDPRHLDFVTLSAHKLYAPYGPGALIGRTDVFAEGTPDMVGGGVVQIVMLDEVVWAGPPDRDEAGSPNHVGAIAMAAALLQLEKIGMDNVAAHEAELTAYALTRFKEVPGIRIYGDEDPENARERLGVIPFQLEGISHFLVAAILGHEFGIGVRNGCFCAHPYILHLLGVDESDAIETKDQIVNNNKANMPGLIRASFGLYNSKDEVDTLVESLKKISKGEYQGEYFQDIPSGEFHPVGYEHDFKSFYSINNFPE